MHQPPLQIVRIANDDPRSVTIAAWNAAIDVAAKSPVLNAAFKLSDVFAQMTASEIAANFAVETGVWSAVRIAISNKDKIVALSVA